MTDNKLTQKQSKLFDEINQLYQAALEFFITNRDLRISLDYDKEKHTRVPNDKVGVILMNKKLKQRFSTLVNSVAARQEPELFNTWMIMTLKDLKKYSKPSEDIQKRFQENIGLQDVYDFYKSNQKEYVRFVLKSLTSLVNESLNDKEEIPSLELDSVGQKLLFLDYLGLLSSISKKTGIDISSSQMGSIVGSIVGEKAGTVTRALRFFHLHHVPKGDKNNPIKIKNLKELRLKFLLLKLEPLARKVDKDIASTKFK